MKPLGLVLIVFVCLVGCGGGSASNSQEPLPTYTPYPTYTPAPTYTPYPTYTPFPTVATPPPAEPAPAPTDQPAPAAMASIGERVEGGGVALTVNGVTEGTARSFYSPTGKLLAIDVTIENVSLDKLPINGLDFHIRDDTGLQLNYELGVNEHEFPLTELVQGDKVRGVLGFDVPADAQGLFFLFEPFMSGNQAFPRISLGQ